MAQPARSKLNTWFPHAQGPIIMSAPMLGTSNGTLAAEVSKAGGIGTAPSTIYPLPPVPPPLFLSSSLHLSPSPFP